MRLELGVLCGVWMGCGAAAPVDPCAGRLAGDLVITEVMADPDGSDTGAEWIEIFNPLTTPIALEGLTLYTRDTDGSNLKSHLVKAGTVSEHGYFVFGDVRSGPNPAWVNYAYGDGLGALGNARGLVGLRCGAIVLDEVSWTSPVTPARSRMLGSAVFPSAQTNDDERLWCDAPAAGTYFGPNAGTPGERNPACAAAAAPGTCLSAGVARPIVQPRAGELVITEVMNNPSISETTGEWLEVLARADLDLNGVTLANGTGASHTLQAAECLRVRAGETALLARSADPALNGGLPAPKALYSVAFGNGAERVTLREGDAGLDEVVLAPSTAGRAWQLDPGKLDATSNDSPANFCVAPRRWSSQGTSDFGSPGAPNPPCSGEVVCQGHVAGDLVITELMPDPDGLDTGNEWLELYNPLYTPADLSGLSLVTRDPAGVVLQTTALTWGSVPGHGYAVLGDVRGPVNPPWVDFSYGAGLGALSNTSGRLSVECGTTTVAQVQWTVAPKAGRSRMLSGAQPPSAAFGQLESNWCDAPLGSVYLVPNAGTPGSANPPCLPEAARGTCLENGVVRPIVPPRAGDLFITEVMANPSASETSGEWFEVLARADVDLNELTIANGLGASSTLTSQGCLRAHAGETVLLARSLDAFINGALPPPKAQYSLSLANGPERLILRHGDAGIDEAAFLPSGNGVSWQFDFSRYDGGSGANDDPASFCLSKTRWQADAGDYGTPGAPNPSCGGAVVSGPGVCVQPDGSQRPIVFAAPGDLVITEWLPDPEGATDALGEYFEVLVNRSVDLNGVAVRNGSSGVTTLTTSRCLPAAAGTFLVFGKTDDFFSNGGLPWVDYLFGFELNNSRDGLHLRAADGGVLDDVAWTSATALPGVAWQLDRGLTWPSDNDAPFNLCPTPASFWNLLPDGDLGTPGRANSPCR